MINNKIEKIYEVIKKNGRTLNLHEIKAMTGVGNGYKHSDINNTAYSSADSHKSEEIYELLNNTTKKLNLYEIKVQTGAGSGYR